MTPAARTQAAIDLLDAIIRAARDGGAAADTLIARWFAERRYAGSKDRRAIRTLVYDAIRLLGERPDSGRAALLALTATQPDLRETFDGSPYGPAAIADDEPAAKPGLAPGWLRKRLFASGIDDRELAALAQRAPLDVRINTLRESAPVLEGAEPLDYPPNAWRFPPDTAADRLPEFTDGTVEVQDAGSQVVTLASGARPGMAVVDLCAGAGGKTLALAAMMANQGSIIACDIDRNRLSRLAPRAERAGVTIAETRLLNPGKEGDALEGVTADLILIDAPCSGTGTWRRNPEARWRLSPDRLSRLIATQAHVLDVAAPHVRVGGSITYIVCSLLDAEGADQVTAFLMRHPGWTAQALALPLGTRHGAGMRLSPLGSSTDGFFVAKLQRA